MKFYLSELLSHEKPLTPPRAKSVFQVCLHTWYRRRASQHDVQNSLLFMSANRPARLHFSLRRALLCTLCLLAMTATGPASAQQDAATVPDRTAATRIELDQEANAIRFFIDGEESAVLDAEGLHVRKSINYVGMITDYGRADFDNHTRHAQEDADAQ